MRKHNLSLRHRVILVGSVPVPGDDPRDILIECRNQCEKPITLQGMEIVSIENGRETKLFFDFLDDENKPLNYFSTTICKQSEVTENNKVLCFKNHKMYECDLYGFFDSPATRKSWVPDESNFYKLCPDKTQNKMTALPSFYSNPNNAEKDPKESVVWVFSEGNNSLYQLYGIPELKDTNDYLYRDKDSFFVTLLYKATYRECFSNNLIELDYLVQVPKPHILIHNTVNIDGETTSKWPAGIYKRTRNLKDNSSNWKRIGAPKKDSVIDEEKKDLIDFKDKGEIRINIIWPADALTTQENKQYCDAAQRFFISFSANIHRCNQEIANGLGTWNKVTWLSLPNLQLENGLTWNNVFTAVGNMIQLKSLHFQNNNPITDFISNESYEKMADHASDYYVALAACLNNLVNLEELHIQGLWLKPRRYLGSGCAYSAKCIMHMKQGVFIDDDYAGVSTEIATLTGIINHKQQAGVKAIIQSICALQALKNLSIDGIPNHGSSDYARKTKKQLLFSPLCIIWDGSCQDADLKLLVVSSAARLAQMASLKTISVYYPGVSCMGYFSWTFKEQLMLSRNAAIPALSFLPVILKDLQ